MKAIELTTLEERLASLEEAIGVNKR
jgi:hypothetical protein